MGIINLEQMERRLGELRAGGEQQEARVRHYQTIVHSTAIAYLIWARLFFIFFFSRSSSLTCNGRRVAFALCFLSTFVFLVLFLDAVLMLCRTEHRLDVIGEKQVELCKEIFKANATDAGDGSSGGVRVEEMMLSNFDGGYSRRSVERKVRIYTIVWAFVGVAAIELYASKFMLCD